MKNLYRRYRPLKLEDVVGQKRVTDSLGVALKQGKIGHAYLFVGPRGCGKTSVARILAHEINGFQYEIEDDYVDIIEIDGASNRGIDNIRELREKVMIAPTTGKYKVYIIDEVHMLTKEAFNALLKTLEEPPEHAVFIMATTDAYKVPVTITSRAQTYTFKLADEKVMFDFLKSVTEKEGIRISNEALKVITKRGGGSFRDSLSLLDQISTLSSDEITKEMVVSAMGLPQDEKIGELLDNYVSGDVVKITTVLKDLLSSGVKAETLAEELISTIVAEPRAELMPLLAKLPEVRAPYAEAKLLVALARATSATAPFARGLESEKSHTLVRRENRPAGEPLGDVRNIDFSDSNQTGTLAKEAIATSPATRVKPTSSDTPADLELAKEAVAASPATPASFDWEGFTMRVQGASEAVYSQLVKTKYELDGDALHIYPMKKIIKSILTRENNKRILVEAASGVKITIHEADEIPNGTKKDEMLTKISDIMGGEVINDGGGSPF